MLEEALQGYTGHLKVQVTGPWTLAATVERPRGDKVLADHGARRELAQALAEGLRDHLADVRRRVAGAGPLLRPGRRARPRRRARAAGADRLRVRQAPRGRPARALRAPGVGVRGGRRVGRGALGALVRGRARRSTCCAAPAPAGSRSTSTCWSPPTTTCSARRSRPGEGVALGVVPSVDPATAAHRPRRSPTGCSAGSTGSASTRTWSVSGCWSPRPAAWPAPHRRGHAAPSPCAARSRPT